MHPNPCAAAETLLGPRANLPTTRFTKATITPMMRLMKVASALPCLPFFGAFMRQHPNQNPADWLTD